MALLSRLRLPQLGRWPRLALVGTCLLLALLSAVSADPATGRTGRSVAVVVAAHDLAAGHRLAAGDVARARWPDDLRPATARADPAQVIGRRLAGPISAHEPITVGRLVGRDLTTGLPAGLVATPLVLDDPHGSDLVHAGDRVDVLATPRPPDLVVTAPAVDPAVTVVAHRALVLAVLPAGDTGTSELVLAVDRATAVRITRDRTGQMFTAIGVPP